MLHFDTSSIFEYNHDTWWSPQCKAPPQAWLKWIILKFLLNRSDVIRSRIKFKIWGYTILFGWSSIGLIIPNYFRSRTNCCGIHGLYRISLHNAFEQKRKLKNKNIFSMWKKKIVIRKMNWKMKNLLTIPNFLLQFYRSKEELENQIHKENKK